MHALFSFLHSMAQHAHPARLLREGERFFSLALTSGRDLARMWPGRVARTGHAGPLDLLMVMGTQRSGTNALFQSLATDRRLTLFNESIDSPVFANFLLRPEREIRPVLRGARGPVLLKPISETFYRSLEAVRDEYREYQMHIIWIYRDPVNVFYSHFREGWIADDEVDDAKRLERWCRRNELALEFQKQCPEQISIVRYEDIIFDEQVFRNLCRWLGLECRPIFRADSGSGRAQMRRDRQEKIDDATAEVMAELEARRDFRPRLIRRLAGRMNGSLGARRPREVITSSPTRAQRSLVRLPEMPGLEFWLEADESSDEGKVAELTIRESGPAKMKSAVPMEGIYRLTCLHGRPAFVFPAEKIRQRRANGGGILHFDEEHDWNFLFDGTGFVLVALYRPENPRPADEPPDLGVILRIGNADGAMPAFCLRWNRIEAASEVCLHSGEQVVVRAPRGSQRDGEWKMVTVASQQDALSVAVDDQLGDVKQIGGKVALLPEAKLHLEIGGTKREPQALFSGALAELRLYRGELSDRELEAVRLSLRTKFRL